ncbi:MAG: GGDEF domain-containing protein [Bacteroidota bacterium]
MSLDVRTIMLVLAALTLMFSGLLALAGKHSSNVKGVGHWALASLLTASGFGFSYSFSTTSPSLHSWPVILASVLIASGLCLQYCGLQRFKDKPVNWRFAAAAVSAVLISGLWFTGIHNDVMNRAIANSIIFAIIFAACARELLIPAESPLRIAYWLTGISFGAFSVLALARAAILWQSSAESYGLFQNIPINPLTFLGVCLLQFSTMFGFVLMLDYRLVGELDKLASLDSLTGAFNRRRLEEEASRLQARCIRTGDPMTVVMIDVDHFKKVNDRYGHQVGDEVLRHVAKTIGTAIREDDYFARYGGEEFCILLPTTTEEAAYVLGERLRQLYADNAFLFNGQRLRSTISIGIADSVDVGAEFKLLVQAADKALYQAKQSGRNLVMRHSTLHQVS